jgi:hypothetical protein
VPTGIPRSDWLTWGEGVARSVCERRSNGKRGFVDEKCRYTDLATPLAVQAGRAIALRTPEKGLVEIDLRKGETVTLYTEGTQPVLAVEPVLAEPWRTNYYGSAALADRALSPYKGFHGPLG